LRLLLDTHTLLWYTLADPRVSAVARSSIQDATNEVSISPASFWEIAIKIGLGKLAIHQPFEDFIDLCLNRYEMA
jgi:PIN domain nuclease of toxin-antitoxin system